MATLSVHAYRGGFLVAAEYPSNSLSVTVDYEGLLITHYFDATSRKSVEQWRTFRKLFDHAPTYRYQGSEGELTMEEAQEADANIVYQQAIIAISAHEDQD